MAALLESLLQSEVDSRFTFVSWQGYENDDHHLLLKVRKEEFVPFLLNFLRDQSSNTLTHGPSTPAKTPSSSRPLRAQGYSSERRGNRSSTGQGSRSTSRVQLFSPTQSSPTLQQHRGRRRSGPFGASATNRQMGARSGHLEDSGRWDGAGRKGKCGGKISEPVSPPTQVELNFNNLEDFPPVGKSLVSPVTTKPSRRINPTPVSAERPNSKPKSCFTSTPLSQPCSPPSMPESMGTAPSATSPLCLQEERELLKKERSKLAQQTSSPLKPIPGVCTPTRPVRPGPKATPDPQTPCPDPAKVTNASELNLLAELYCACISENLVPCVFLELFFVLQLLTTRSVFASETEEQAHISCFFFCEFWRIILLLSHLDRCTLRLLAENERVGAFSPALRDRLVQTQDTCRAKVLPDPTTFIHSVPFQPATDNRTNFSSDKAFHIFKKQRDIFYELLREWEDYHKEPGWEFEAALGNRVRTMVSQLTAAGNHCHFARLFQKQLVQMCKGPRVLGSPSDAPDADLLGMVGADSLGRLKRLQERLIQPQALSGPCPPPSFPGHQEFFKDFLQTASCCQLNQHLKDGLCQQLLQLNEVSILGPEATSAAGEEGKQRFSSVLLVARLLAKFLGFISFLPYQTSEAPSREIQEAAIALRSKCAPVLDVCGVLRSCVHRKRTVLTVPWLVEFLSMLDYTGPFLPCYRTALGLLLQLYRRMRLSQGQFYLNQLLLVAVLGWLFQDCLALVDQQLLYTCCPYLGEFRKLLAAFVSGSASKTGGLIRKITPTSAEPRGPPTNRSQQKLHLDLEQAFFHNQPPSLKRTVEFVAERVGSNCVKHIKATLVSELVKGGEKTLRDGLGSEGVNAAKLNVSICAQLCDAGMQALERATRFCSANAPRAVRVLLPEETSETVSELVNITTRLATEKACSWLSSNITTLIKREWKSSFERVMKNVPCPANTESADTDGTGQSLQLLRNFSGQDAVSSCPPDCTHKAPLSSDVIIEIKEVLSIAVGPRTEEEVLMVQQIDTLLYKVGQTLRCRKFMSSVAEQMLLRCTVLLACKLGNFSTKRAGVDVRSLLEDFVLLWTNIPSAPAPLHLLLSEPTLTAVLHASDMQVTRRNYLLLITLLIEKGLLKEEEVGRHWIKLSELSWPVVMVSYIHTSKEKKQGLHFVHGQQMIMSCLFPRLYHRNLLRSFRSFRWSRLHQCLQSNIVTYCRSHHDQQMEPPYTTRMIQAKHLHTGKQLRPQ
uniref:Codanin-1 C-terminal domain-containing protein n=1 Tax=Pygocentrus nattereri TaxID=42514 RepID=A0AAR2JCR4_PYGNA